MFKSVVNAFKTKELRKKILYTIFLLIIFRLGEFITVPGVNASALKDALGNYDALGFMDMISGGGLSQMSVLAMSITPYINSSIIMQLLTVAIPALERIARDGDEGRKKIAQYTRYLTIILAFIQSTGMYFGFTDLILDRNALSYLTVILSLTAGTAFLMWLGEKITENGIGNGISLIIFAGIVSRFPSIVTTIYENIKAGSLSYIVALIFVVVLVVVFGFIVLMNDAERRIPVQYAKRVVGRKMYGGQSTYIPIKVSMAGVIPIIFAMSIMMFPATIMQLFGKQDNWVMRNILSSNSWIYIVLYFLLILFFTFFYTKIQFNTIEIANNMKNNGGSIRGIRPGKPTSDYIDKSLNKITMAGAVFIGLVAVVPMILAKVFGLGGIAIGGTSLLIVVGVILETGKQIESQMMMRNYKGFLE
ncbi:MAG: preprotein translocase subunit SecY [Clostridia bacterium]|nr:preprotein translocase subunit SecY [Clostridia bacterium]